jgi:predicted MFS family arabinose efflux permease
MESETNGSASPADLSPEVRRHERLILIILSAVQFTTIVDFLIVMPLGPQLVRKLEISTMQFGLIVSSYTFAAGAAGLVASAIVDRFSRRNLFMTLYGGFLLGTLLCALAPTYFTLVLARIATGAFGGILGGMAMTIIGDVFPEQRRGRATGLLMTGFSLASVAGVPLGMYLGTNYGWHVPFMVLVVGGLPALLLIPFALPRLDAHVHKSHVDPLKLVGEIFSQPNHLNAFLLISVLMIGSFAVFPFVSAYLVANVGLTEHQIPYIYIVGGALTLLSSPIVGRLADRHGKLTMFRIISPASALLFLAITHLWPTTLTIAATVFGVLMVCNVGRMIAAMAMITSSVEPHRRGAFLSANSCVQHIACGIGSVIGGAAIFQPPDGPIEHFGRAGWIAAISIVASIWLAGRVRILDQGPGAGHEVSAEKLSLAAAAEATADAGEPLITAAEE